MNSTVTIKILPVQIHQPKYRCKTQKIQDFRILKFIISAHIANLQLPLLPQDFGLMAFRIYLPQAGRLRQLGF